MRWVGKGGKLGFFLDLGDLSCYGVKWGCKFKRVFGIGFVVWLCF